MRVSVRIDFGEGLRMGPGKAQLLELIAEHGSISAAGRAMDMSYRRAWKLVESMNGTFRQPLVEAHTGGTGGGHAALTPTGREVLRLYRAVEAQAGSDTAALGQLADLLPA
jgi:molybdate transport system regulatory protein